jgi:hypothetical protein
VTAAEPVPASGGRDPDADYFQSIEEFFVSRRGDPLFLSNADWLLIRRWRRAGLPLRIALRGIADAMDAHDRSWSRHQKVGSLRYCEAEVEAAADRWRQALLHGEDEPQADQVRTRLANELAKAEALGPAGRRTALRLSDGLLAPARDRETPERLEKWLRGAEEELVAAIEEDGGRDLRQRIADEIERDLGAYRERLPAAVLDQVRAESRTRRLLETHGLPRLSLWPL